MESDAREPQTRRSPATTGGADAAEPIPRAGVEKSPRPAEATCECSPREGRRPTEALTVTDRHCAEASPLHSQQALTSEDMSGVTGTSGIPARNTAPRRAREFRIITAALAVVCGVLVNRRLRQQRCGATALETSIARRECIRGRQLDGIALAKASGKYAKASKLNAATIAAAKRQVEAGAPEAHVARALGGQPVLVTSPLNGTDLYAAARAMPLTRPSCRSAAPKAAFRLFREPPLDRPAAALPPGLSSRRVPRRPSLSRLWANDYDITAGTANWRSRCPG